MRREGEWERVQGLRERQGRVMPSVGWSKGIRKGEGGRREHVAGGRGACTASPYQCQVIMSPK